MIRGKTKEKKCLRCKEIFHPRVADLKRGWGKFCSKSCNTYHDIDYYKEVYQERVAIMMVDGGKTEKQAENDALHDTQELFRKDKGLTFSDSRIYTVVNKLKSR